MTDRPAPDGPGPDPDERAALIAGAASGDLSPAEQRAYDALATADPAVALETSRMRELLDRIADLPAGSTSAVTPDEALHRRVLAIPHTADGRDTTAPGASPSRRRVPALAAAAAIFVIGGVAGGAVVAQTGGPTVPQPSDGPPTGPPGTLGAVEPIDFRGEPSEVDIDASLVAHTWGTETVLDMDGWEPGASYRLVLVAQDGTTEESGTFLGSTVQIDCRMNGALLREDVDAVEIRDERDRVVATSDVPAVDGSA